MAGFVTDFNWLSPVSCFNHARVGTVSMGLCAGRFIIIIITVAMLLATLFLLQLQLRSKGWLSKSSYRSLKTWLLILITLYLVDNVVRFVF
jgi:hypothetical protein